MIPVPGPKASSIARSLANSVKSLGLIPEKHQVITVFIHLLKNAVNIRNFDNSNGSMMIVTAYEK